MKYFLDTVETIPGGVGFSHFGMTHLVWLAVGMILTVICCIWYRKMSDCAKTVWKRTIALLILVDEIFKVAMLIIGGRFSAGYLPFHLCSINIFVILIHAFKPSKLLSGFLYTVCIPGAIAALLFPTWTSLPFCNFMHLHSFTIHILLAMYPIVLTASGELAPSVKSLHKYLLLLVVMAIPVWAINFLLDTNFMFLMFAEEGNPLFLFEQLWGSHLLGFPVLITAILIVMYVPLVIYRKLRKKEL